MCLNKGSKVYFYTKIHKARIANTRISQKYKQKVSVRGKPHLAES